MSSRQIYFRLLTWVKPYWRVFVIAILGMVATAATEPVAPWLLKTLIDNGFKAASEREIILLPLAIVGISSCAALRRLPPVFRWPGSQRASFSTCVRPCSAA